MDHSSTCKWNDQRSLKQMFNSMLKIECIYVFDCWDLHLHFCCLTFPFLIWRSENDSFFVRMMGHFALNKSNSTRNHSCQSLCRRVVFTNIQYLFYNRMVKFSFKPETGTISRTKVLLNPGHKTWHLLRFFMLIHS